MQNFAPVFRGKILADVDGGRRLRTPYVFCRQDIERGQCGVAKMAQERHRDVVGGGVGNAGEVDLLGEHGFELVGHEGPR